MKIAVFAVIATSWLLAVAVQAFAPVPSSVAFYPRATTAVGLAAAKYKTMDEILAKFPEDKPVLINFYDANTEAKIKDDILRAKTLLKDRATLVSIKQQDYPDIAK